MNHILTSVLSRMKKENYIHENNFLFYSSLQLQQQQQKQMLHNEQEKPFYYFTDNCTSS